MNEELNSCKSILKENNILYIDDYYEMFIYICINSTLFWNIWLVENKLKTYKNIGIFEFNPEELLG